MRLEEWQKFIESQFLEDEAEKEISPPEPEPGSETAKEEKPPVTLSLPLEMEEMRDSSPALEAEERGALLAPERQAGASVSFEATLNFDTEIAAIPDFARYLPASRPPYGAPTEQNASVVREEVSPLESRSEPPLAPEESSEAAPKMTRRTPLTRARHARNVKPENVPSILSEADLWRKVPHHVQTLLALERMEEQETAQYSYKRTFAEGRRELIERLLDPILSLEDTARLLNVCPTTVRRYTNRGILTHYRKEPEHGLANTSATNRETRQRRFRLSDILAFLETQQTALEADRNQEEKKARKGTKPTS